MTRQPEADRSKSRVEVLRPDEVARIFRVDNKTASRWAVEGRLPAFKTPTGRWRFYGAPVREFLRKAADGPV